MNTIGIKKRGEKISIWWWSRSLLRNGSISERTWRVNEWDEVSSRTTRRREQNKFLEERGMAFLRQQGHAESRASRTQRQMKKKRFGCIPGILPTELFPNTRLGGPLNSSRNNGAAKERQICSIRSFWKRPTSIGGLSMHVARSDPIVHSGRQVTSVFVIQTYRITFLHEATGWKSPASADGRIHGLVINGTFLTFVFKC